MMTSGTQSTIQNSRNFWLFALKVLGIIFFSLAVFCILLWLFRLPVAGFALQKILARQGIEAFVEVESLDLNRVRLRTLRLGPETEPAVQVKTVILTYAWPEILHGKFKSLVLEDPEINLVWHDKGPGLKNLVLPSSQGGEKTSLTLPQDITIKNAVVNLATSVGEFRLQGEVAGGEKKGWEIVLDLQPVSLDRSGVNIAFDGIKAKLSYHDSGITASLKADFEDLQTPDGGVENTVLNLTLKGRTHLVRKVDNWSQSLHDFTGTASLSFSFENAFLAEEHRQSFPEKLLSVSRDLPLAEVFTPSLIAQFEDSLEAFEGQGHITLTAGEEGLSFFMPRPLQLRSGSGFSLEVKPLSQDQTFLEYDRSSSLLRALGALKLEGDPEANITRFDARFQWPEGEKPVFKSLQTEGAVRLRGRDKAQLDLQADQILLDKQGEDIGLRLRGLLGYTGPCGTLCPGAYTESQLHKAEIRGSLGVEIREKEGSVFLEKAGMLFSLKDFQGPDFHLFDLKARIRPFIPEKKALSWGKEGIGLEVYLSKPEGSLQQGQLLFERVNLKGDIHLGLQKERLFFETSQPVPFSFAHVKQESFRIKDFSLLLNPGMKGVWALGKNREGNVQAGWRKARAQNLIMEDFSGELSLGKGSFSLVAEKDVTLKARLQKLEGRMLKPLAVKDFPLMGRFHIPLINFDLSQKDETPPYFTLGLEKGSAGFQTLSPGLLQDGIGAQNLFIKLEGDLSQKPHMTFRNFETEVHFQGERPPLTPSKLEGKGDLNGKLLKAVVSLSPLAARDQTLTAHLTHRFDNNKGKADLKLKTIDFEPDGFQPTMITPLLQGWLVDTRGKLGGQACFTWGEGAFTSTASLDIRHIDTKLSWGQIFGLSSHMDFLSLWPLITKGPQTLTLKGADLGLPIEEGEIVFRADKGEVVHLLKAEWPFLGGVLGIQPFEYKPGMGKKETSLYVDNIDLEKLSKRLEKLKIDISGLLKGNLPLVITPQGLHIKGGFFETLEDGIFRYQGSADQAVKDNEQAKLAFDLLKDFHYKKMLLRLDGDIRKDMTAVLNMSGYNPDVLYGSPVDFTITLGANFLELLKAQLASTDLEKAAETADTLPER